MAATDFPNAPTVNQVFTTPSGSSYIWDGVKWVNGVCGGAAFGPSNIIAGTCMSVTPSGSNATVSASVPCIQTPWLQAINGNLQLLNNTGGIAVGGAAQTSNLIVFNGNTGLGVGNPAYRLSVMGAASVLSGSASTNMAFYFGRTATDGTLAVAGAANQMASGASQGDVILRSEAQKVILGSAGNGILYITSTHAEVSCGGGLFISADPVSSGGGINYQIARDGPSGSLFFIGHQPTFTGYQFQVTPGTGPVTTVASITNLGLFGINIVSPVGCLDVRASASNASAYMYYTGNVGNWYPIFNQTSLAIGWNFQAGLQEVDFVNTTSIGGASGGFRWYQQTGASAMTYLAGIDATGNLFANRFECASAYFGPSTTGGTPMLFANNSDPSAGMAVQTICIWADVSNSRLVLDFKTNAGTIVRGYVPVS